MLYFWLMVIVAVAPCLVILYKVYQLDKIEKEPPRLLLKLLLFGMLSVIPAILLEMLAQNLLYLIIPTENVLHLLIKGFIGVALVEEGCKYFFVKKGAWNDKAFSHTFDAVVYAVFVSLGFALVENIKYVFNFGIGTGISRAFLAIPLHASCAVYMGINLGLAKQYQSRGDMVDCKKRLRRALWLPVFLHGLYDYCLFVGNWISTVVFFVVVVVLFTRTLRSLKESSGGDQTIGYDPYQ